MVRIFLFSVLLTLVSIVAFSQGRQIEIRSSELIKGFQASGFARVIRPVFAQEGSTLAADSADFNQAANTFDAFGHVVITQPSGTTIYSDLLNYDGNTKLAILTNNVRLIDGDVTLTTNNLTYNMNTRIGIYTGGGKIVNGKNVLTSKNGYYFAATRDAYFRNNVILTTPDALIKNDTLRYNSNSKIAYFYGPTNIYGKDDTLYTENGTYNTTNEQARFGKNNLYTQGSKSLTGDSLFYDRKAGYGKAMGHVTFIDTAEKAILKGGIGEYKKSDESILVTKNPYVVIISETDSSKVDSIWMTADTLLSKVVFTRDLIPYKQDEIIPDDQISTKETPEINTQDAIKPVMEDQKGNSLALRNGSKKPEMDVTPDRAEIAAEEKIPPPVKIPPPNLEKKKEKSVKNTLNKKALSDTAQVVSSIKDSVSTDTTRTRMIMAYHNAKIFKSDLQARADSMFFSYSDSTVRCYVNPMVWAQGSQLSGDTIYLQMKNKKLDNMLLQHNSFIVNTEDADSTNFNQIKGKVITGYFKDNKLNNMFVDGNAESVYYLKEDSAYSGLNHMISSRLRILLKDNKLNNISAISTIEASITPMKDLKEEERVLKGFIWKPRDRPKSKEEIIPQLMAEQKPVAAKKSAKKSSPAKSAPTKSTPSKANPAKRTEQNTPVKAPAIVVPKTAVKTVSKTSQN
uniref:OstA-like protein n=1 Tax=Daejeonella sp. TaxID=2805397 RepID=UPI00404942B4